MKSRMLARGACAAAVAIVTLAGCGKSTPSGGQPTSQAHPTDSVAKDYNVKAASATSRISGDDGRVVPATATAPSDRVATGVEPAPLPAGPTGPLPLEELAPGVSMLRVFLSEAHAKTCLVGVGDAFPMVELADLAGNERALADLMGERLTVVVFWNAKQPTSLDELADLQSRIVDQFGERGVHVVGINEHDDPRLAGELVEQAGAKFANLSDRQEAALATVATEKIPRTYLIDAAGKIVWFDMEYSRTTRRELISAVRYLLGQN